MGNAKFNLHQKYLRFRRGVTFHTYKNVRIFYDFSEHLCISNVGTYLLLVDFNYIVALLADFTYQDD